MLAWSPTPRLTATADTKTLDRVLDQDGAGSRGRVKSVSCLALGLGSLLAVACHHDPVDAAGVRASLVRGGFGVGTSRGVDPRASAYPGVRSSECFDATRGDTVSVCVWLWSGDGLPDSFPLEAFSQDADAYTAARNAVFVVVTPTGGAGEDTTGYGAIRAAFGD